MKLPQAMFAAGQFLSGLLVVVVGFMFAIEAVKAESGWAMIFSWAVLFTGIYLVLDILAPDD